MRIKHSLTIDDADAMTAAGIAAAMEAAVVVSIAVVDEAGALLRFHRMDGARAYTVDLASRKARTSAAIGVATRELVQLYANRLMHSSEFIAMQGGLPVIHEGMCAGAIGISGATGDVDDAIAEAGVRVLVAR